MDIKETSSSLVIDDWAMILVPYKLSPNFPQFPHLTCHKYTMYSGKTTGGTWELWPKLGKWPIFFFWLVVEPPLRKIWVRHLGWLFPIYGKIKNMFQTTNQFFFWGYPVNVYTAEDHLPSGQLSSWSSKRQRGQAQEKPNLKKWDVAYWWKHHGDIDIKWYNMI